MRGSVTGNDVATANFNLAYDETQGSFGSVGASGQTVSMTVDGTRYSSLTPDNNGAYTDGDSDGVSLLIEGVSNVPGTIFFNPNPNPVAQIIGGTHSTIDGTYVLYRTGGYNLSQSQTHVDLDYAYGFATIGIQTPQAVVELQSLTATYTGTSSIAISPLEIRSSSDSSLEFLFDGTLNMTVNFDTNMIEGGNAVFSDVASRNVGSITFGPAPIVNNGFAGTFTAGSTFRAETGITDNPTGNYSGYFFGDTANDLAGVTRFTGRNGNRNLIAIGGFRGDRQ